MHATALSLIIALIGLNMQSVVNVVNVALARNGRNFWLFSSQKHSFLKILKKIDLHIMAWTNDLTHANMIQWIDGMNQYTHLRIDLKSVWLFRVLLLLTNEDSSLVFLFSQSTTTVSNRFCGANTFFACSIKFWQLQFCACLLRKYRALIFDPGVVLSSISKTSGLPLTKSLNFLNP